MCSAVRYSRFVWYCAQDHSHMIGQATEGPHHLQREGWLLCWRAPPARYEDFGHRIAVPDTSLRSQESDTLCRSLLQRATAPWRPSSPCEVGLYRLLRNPIPITGRYTDIPVSLPTSVKLNYCSLICHLLPKPFLHYTIQWHLYFCPFARSVPRDTGLASEASGASRLSCGRV